MTPEVSYDDACHARACLKGLLLAEAEAARHGIEITRPVPMRLVIKHMPIEYALWATRLLPEEFSPSLRALAENLIIATLNADVVKIPQERKWRIYSAMKGARRHLYFNDRYLLRVFNAEAPDDEARRMECTLAYSTYKRVLNWLWRITPVKDRHSFIHMRWKFNQIAKEQAEHWCTEVEQQETK